MAIDAPIIAITVAFHRPDALQRQLLSLRGQVDRVVVVNVENDPRVSQVVGGSSGELALLPLARNRGYAAAINYGVSSIDGPATVVVGNDDVTYEYDAVAKLVEAVRSGRAEVAAPLVRNPDGNPSRTIVAHPSLRRLLLEWVILPDRPIPWLARRGAVHKWRLPDSEEAVPGVAAAVLVADIGLLRRHPVPEAYFLYWEEREWFMLLARSGYRVLYCPSATVMHAGGADVVRPDKQALLARNAVRCLARTASARGAAVAWILIVLWQTRLVVTAGVRMAFRMPGSGSLMRSRRAGLSAAIRSLALVLQPGSEAS